MRSTRLVSSTVCCLAVVAASWAVPAHAADVRVAGPLMDLQATADATDGATGRVSVNTASGHTTVVLHLQGLDAGAAGRRFGAHVHVGPCVAGNGTAAGPHYNSDVAAGVDEPEVSARTEVWLDFVVTPAGTATSVAQVPFAIPAGGARSVVVHHDETAPNGTAGARLACLGLEP